MHSWGQDRPSEPGDAGPWALTGSTLTTKAGSGTCVNSTGGVPSDAAIWHLVAGIADELGIPDPEVMLPHSSLGNTVMATTFPKTDGTVCHGFGGGFQPLTLTGPPPPPIFPLPSAPQPS